MRRLDVLHAGLLECVKSIVWLGQCFDCSLPADLGYRQVEEVRGVEVSSHRYLRLSLRRSVRRDAFAVASLPGSACRDSS